jgi:acylphosphatase
MFESEAVERRRVHYHGRVQGVGFRYTTQRIAAGFRVAGYVQNLSDGRVMAVIQGDARELDRFLAAVMNELGHFVEETTVQRESVEEGLDGFGIRF